MNLLKAKILILIFLIPLLSFSQKKDSSSVSKNKIDSVGKIVLKTVNDTLKKNGIAQLKVKKASDFHFFQDVFGKIDSTKRKKLPKIALYRSLILPGWGQVTNHQAWLAPIILIAAYTTSLGFENQSKGIYFGIRPFNIRYNAYKGYLTDAVATETINPSSTGVLIDGKGPYTSTQILPWVNTYRRYRDLTYIGFAAGWALQAVQANVQAHLRTFDMSDNISLKFQPDFQVTPYGSAMGLSAKIIFK